MQRWEYLAITCPQTWTQEGQVGGEKVLHLCPVETVMDHLGLQGWELVSTEAAAGGRGHTSAPQSTLYFKRPAP